MSDIRNEAVREIEAARAVKTALSNLTDDEDTLRDTLEGETNLDGIIRELVLSIAVDAGLRDGAKAAAKSISERAERFNARIDAKRELIRLAMELADWRTKEFDIATVTLKKPPAAVQITDEAEIPAKFWKPSDPKLDRKAVLDALKSGEAVEGAALKNGAPVIEIRSK